MTACAAAVTARSAVAACSSNRVDSSARNSRSLFKLSQNVVWVRALMPLFMSTKCVCASRSRAPTMSGRALRLSIIWVRYSSSVIGTAFSGDVTGKFSRGCPLRVCRVQPRVCLGACPAERPHSCQPYRCRRTFPLPRKRAAPGSLPRFLKARSSERPDG